MFIISLTYKKPLEDVERFLQEHCAFLDTCYATGMFICSGRKKPRTGGVILAMASDKAQIDAVIKEDPFYTNGIADYEIIEVELTQYSELFKPLIK